MKDIRFNINDLDNWRLFVPNADPGDIAIFDDKGNSYRAEQRSYIDEMGRKGILIDFYGSGIGLEPWTINRINESVDTSARIGYSSDGESWHDDYAPEDAWIRFSNDLGETWSAGVRIGDSPDLGRMKVQYSPDGADWHDGTLPGDTRMRISGDNGKTWSDSVPLNDPDVGKTAVQYSPDGVDWHDGLRPGDTQMRVSGDNGKTWSGDPIPVANPDAQTKVQHSDDGGKTWHDDPRPGDTSMRVSGDGGKTWSEPVRAGLEEEPVRVQYAGDDGEWHEGHLPTDTQLRLSADGGSTWTEPIPSESKANDRITTQYSDGSGFWHAGRRPGDTQVRMSANDGMDWTEPMPSEDRSSRRITVQYSIDGKYWHEVNSPSDTMMRLSDNGGQSWSEPVPMAPAVRDTVRIQYSSDGQSWHDDYAPDDTSMRFSNDGGGSWTAPVPIGGGSVNPGGGSQEGGAPAADRKFRASDLTGGKLFVPGASPGDVAVYDGAGELVMAGQKDACDTNGVRGVLIDLSKSGMGDGEWSLNYIPNGGSSGMAIEYSLDGQSWHSGCLPGDAQVRFSGDGGKTWTPGISVGGAPGGNPGGGSGGGDVPGGNPGGNPGGGSGGGDVPGGGSGGNPGGGSGEPDLSVGGFTGELIHNFIPRLHYPVPSVEFIVNEMVYPQIWMFCEIMAHYEVANIEADGKFHFSYRHWNRAYLPQVFLNGGSVPLAPSAYEVDYGEGSVTPKFEAAPGDNLICTYNFTWFKPETLISYVYRSIGTINYHGQGAVTQYTVEDLPESMWGIAADLCVAMAMENLILSQTVWYGKLIFAISGNDLYNGGGDVGSQLETIKRNCEDRAYSELENERARAPHYLARPTPAYWRSVTLGNGMRPGPHGQTGYGKTRGIKYNTMRGMTGPDLGL